MQFPEERNEIVAPKFARKSTVDVIDAAPEPRFEKDIEARVALHDFFFRCKHAATRFSIKATYCKEKKHCE